MERSRPTADAPTLVAEHLSKVHRLDGHELRSVDDVSFTVAAGEIVALIGPSGSGKTSLLHLLGGLDTPDAGTVSLAGNRWAYLSRDERARHRRRICGFVLQGDSLLPQATAAENVELPLLLDGVLSSERRQRTADALALVGLEEHSGKLSEQLSGGQKQRVAVARALVIRPAVMLADEPTGSLDSHNARRIVDLIVGAARSLAMAVVLVTHDPDVSRRADRVLRLHSGRLGVDGGDEGV